MKIKIVSLKPEDISELNDAKSLYTIDFRSISENMDYEIPAMWKYENLTPWLTDDKFVTVNEGSSSLKYRGENKYIVVKRASSPKKSIYQRIGDKIPRGIKRIWVAVPHPEADKLARIKGLSINYSFASFRRRNDKIVQKKLLGKMTPPWKIIASEGRIEEFIKRKSGYIKRAEGSGGYTVFPVDKVKEDQLAALRGCSGEKIAWYFENEVKGDCYSIQCLKNGGEVSIFGYAKQLIQERRYFYGAKIMDLDKLRSRIAKQLSQAIESLDPLLKGYHGFFGIDFIVNQAGIVKVLEANIRLTAMTIPTYLNNCSGAGGAVFLEDQGKNSGDVLDSSIIVTSDDNEAAVDVLNLKPLGGRLGTRVSLKLKNCASLSKALVDQEVDELRRVVEMTLGRVVKGVHYNFWPFGWTLCFILQESHVAISSWYLEKMIILESASCSQSLDPEILRQKLVKHFGADNGCKIKVAKI